MTDEECEQVFQELRQITIGARLSWIVTQVDEEIRFGRTSTKRVRARVEPAEELAVEDLAERTRTSKIKVSTTRPYTSRERLGMLVDALDRTVVGVNDMEDGLRKYLVKQTWPWDSIQFIGTDESIPHPVTINRIGDLKRAVRVAEFRGLMRTLRGLI